MVAVCNNPDIPNLRPGIIPFLTADYLGKMYVYADCFHGNYLCAL